MSTKFYIKDENGVYLSVDGKTRYTCLEGRELYLFLKSEEGKKRSFHVDIDDSGNKIGFEAESETVRELEKDNRRERYLNTVKLECNITFVSGNTPVEDTDYAELFDTIEDESQDIDRNLLKQEQLYTLRKAILSLNKLDRRLLYYLFFKTNPLTEEQAARKFGITQQAVSKRKKAIFEKIKKYF